MEERQQKLLNLLVENHIKSAEPIGSKFLVEKCGLDYGEATVRNELRDLEESGYLTHPHTSAGRVPTEEGYRVYVKSLDLNKGKITAKENEFFGMSVEKSVEPEIRLKNMAKAAAEISKETAILAFSPEKVYYTGLSNLFAKPEFAEMNMVASVSQVFDHCEDCLVKFYDEINDEPQFFIGHDHGFGHMLSVLAFKFDNNSMFALLGPMRMNYSRNWVLIKRAKELI